MTQLNGNDKQREEREKFVFAFNRTMITIWCEQITLLNVIDTGRLLRSLKALPVRADGRFIEIGLSQSFLEYGLCRTLALERKSQEATQATSGVNASVRRNPGSPESITLPS